MILRISFVDGSSEKSLKAFLRISVSSGDHSFLLDAVDLVEGLSESHPTSLRLWFFPDTSDSGGVAFGRSVFIM